MADRENCVFCRIYDRNESDHIVYKDEDFIAFQDIKPSSKLHYLVVTREHIPNAKCLMMNQKEIVEKLVEIGKKIVGDLEADLLDSRFGFHWPPFDSISHLHLHVISPASEMGFLSRWIFRPGTWWFATPEDVLKYMARK